MVFTAGSTGIFARVLHASHVAASAATVLHFSVQYSCPKSAIRKAVASDSLKRYFLIDEAF